MANERSSWAVGWAYFASVMLMLIGVFHVVAGIVALGKHEVYVVGPQYVFNFNVTSWGWIHIIAGIIVFLAGLGVLSGNVAARTVGVIVAAISAIANFLWLPYYPIWSIVIIAIDVAVIWALTAHGRDVVEP